LLCGYLFAHGDGAVCIQGAGRTVGAARGHRWDKAPRQRYRFLNGCGHDWVWDQACGQPAGVRTGCRDPDLNHVVAIVGNGILNVVDAQTQPPRASALGTSSIARGNWIYRRGIHASSSQ
jgi:hypothetical protein